MKFACYATLIRLRFLGILHIRISSSVSVVYFHRDERIFLCSDFHTLPLFLRLLCM